MGKSATQIAENLNWSDYWPGGVPGGPTLLGSNTTTEEAPGPMPMPPTALDFYGSPQVVQQPDTGYWSSWPLPQQPARGASSGLEAMPFPTDPYIAVTPTDSYIAATSMPIDSYVATRTPVDYSQFITQDQLANFSPDLSGYATTQSVADQLANFAPDLSGYATTQSVADQLANFTPNLSGYATTQPVADQPANYGPEIDSSGYATNASAADQLVNYNPIDPVAGFVSTESVENYNPISGSGYATTTTPIANSFNINPNADYSGYATTATTAPTTQPSTYNPSDVSGFANTESALAGDFGPDINVEIGDDVIRQGMIDTILAGGTMPPQDVLDRFNINPDTDLSGYATSAPAGQVPSDTSAQQGVSNFDPNALVEQYNNSQAAQNFGLSVTYDPNTNEMVQDVGGFGFSGDNRYIRSSLEDFANQTGIGLPTGQVADAGATTGAVANALGLATTESVADQFANYNPEIDLSSYATNESVANAVAEALANYNPVDLSGYATTESVANQFADFNPNIDLSGYATTESMGNRFANFNPNIDLSGYATTGSVADQFADFSPEIDLSGYATTGSLADQRAEILANQKAGIDALKLEYDQLQGGSNFDPNAMVAQYNNSPAAQNFGLTVTYDPNTNELVEDMGGFGFSGANRYKRYSPAAFAQERLGMAPPAATAGNTTTTPLGLTMNLGADIGI